MEEERITAYKGFDKYLKCRGFQYEIGKEYEEKDIEICRRGFHACENPLDVFSYYDMVGSRFCEVEQSGKIQKKDDDTKVCSSKISIKAELKLADMINLGVEWLKEKTNPSKIINMTTDEKSGYGAKIGSSGDYAQIGSSVDDAQIGSSGYGAKIGSSGDYAQIGSSGYGAKIGSSGYGAKIGSSGDYAQIGSSGDYARIGSSGNGAKIGSSGYGAKIGSSGDGAKIGSSRYGAKIGSSGNDAQIGSSGNGAKIGSSGDGAKIGSSGYGAKIGSSGDYAQIDSMGENSVIMCAGNNSIVKAKIGSWITLAEWGHVDGKCTPICVKTEYVDGERIKEDTWYKLENGEFVECD